MSLQNRNSDSKQLSAFRRALYTAVEQQGEERAAEAEERLLAAITAAPVISSNTERPRRLPVIAAVIAAATLLLSIGAVLLSLLLPPPGARIHRLTGLLSLGEISASMKRRYAVPADEGAKIVWPDNTALWLKGSTDVGFSDDSLAHLEMESGALLAVVTPRVRRDFSIRTPLGTVRVRGTTFSVWVRDDVVTVRLHEGRVVFDRPDGSITLDAGEAARIEGKEKGVVTAIDEDGILQDLMIAERTAELQGPSVPVLWRNIEMSPLDVVADSPTLRKQSTSLGIKKRRGKRRPSKPLQAPTAAADAGFSQFVDPDILAIDVTHRPAAPDQLLLIESLIRARAYNDCIVQAEAALRNPEPDLDRERMLYLKGYCDMRAGHLKAGREAFENYLIQFPTGRHQKRIQEILGE